MRSVELMRTSLTKWAKKLPWSIQEYLPGVEKQQHDVRSDHLFHRAGGINVEIFDVFVIVCLVPRS